ncbi:MAG: hypothetical protein C0626_05740 [Arcobacter sp.]|uniref:hypothetical protein n=1 Tax=uncultured Arcobacter sp. TaxID=165434 RepID=UPI000CB07DC7|nr:hypothetical protein [uncultured Arcobacter sp.]PLY10477.1 MAG: hypothetical protein C0626_05740 [Arcobacter sp.]
MEHLKYIKEIVFKQKKLILTFIIITTLLAIGLKIILQNNYKKNDFLIGKLELQMGFLTVYNDIIKENEKSFIKEPLTHISQFKDQFVELKTDHREKKVSQAKIYLYSVGKDKDLIENHLKQAIKKLNDIEKSIVLKISKEKIVKEIVYSNVLKDVEFSPKPYYLNYYFVVSVFLLSFISSICLGIYREKYLNDK